VNFIVGKGNERRGETRGEKKRETRKKETNCADVFRSLGSEQRALFLVQLFPPSSTVLLRSTSVRYMTLSYRYSDLIPLRLPFPPDACGLNEAVKASSGYPGDERAMQRS
jgi:hypothetical protein